MASTTEQLGVDRYRLIDSERERLEKFYDEYPSAHRPFDMNRWLARCFERHEELIERFGGWRHYTSYGLTGEDKCLATDDVREVVGQVTTMFELGATLYANSNVKPTVTLRPLPLGDDLPFVSLYAEQSLRSPLAPSDMEVFCFGPSMDSVKIRKGQRVSRAILNAVRKRYKDSPPYIQYWETVFERLGVLWAARRGAKVVISCAPSDFVRLGHTVEPSSCYRTGGDYEAAKFYLATMANSIVAMTFDSGSDSDCDLGRMRSRCFGFMELTGGAILTNFYGDPKAQCLPPLRAALSAITGVPHTVEELETIRNMDDIYLNGDDVAVGPDWASLRRVVARVQNPDTSWIDLRACAECGERNGLVTCDSCEDDTCCGRTLSCGCHICNSHDYEVCDECERESCCGDVRYRLGPSQVLCRDCETAYRDEEEAAKDEGDEA